MTDLPAQLRAVAAAPEQISTNVVSVAHLCGLAAEEIERNAVIQFAMRAALRQASFCLRERLPGNIDAEYTIKQIDRALAEKENP